MTVKPLRRRVGRVGLQAYILLVIVEQSVSQWTKVSPSPRLYGQLASSRQNVSRARALPSSDLSFATCTPQLTGLLDGSVAEGSTRDPRMYRE